MRPHRRAKAKRKDPDVLSSSSPAKKRRKGMPKTVTIQEAISSSSSSSESSSEEDGNEEVVKAQKKENHQAKTPAQPNIASNTNDGKKQHEQQHQAITPPPVQQSLPVPEAMAPPVPHAMPASQHQHVVQVAATPPSSTSNMVVHSEEQVRVPPMFHTHVMQDPHSLIYKQFLTEDDYAALAAFLQQTVSNCVKMCHVVDARGIEHIAKHTLRTHIWQINMIRQEGNIQLGVLDRQRSDNMLRLVTQNIVGSAMNHSACTTFESISNNVVVCAKAHIMLEASFQPDSKGVHDLGKITNQIVTTMKTEEFVNYLCKVVFHEQMSFPVCELLTKRMFGEWRNNGKAPAPLRNMAKNIVEKVISRYIYNMVEKQMQNNF